MIKLSRAGMELLVDLEGLKLTMYKDTKGLPTIGIGHLILPSEQHLLTVRLTVEEAYELKRQDLVRFENNLQSIIEYYDLTLTQPQYDALISFMFNIGVKAFNSSTLYKKLIKGWVDEVALEFPKWLKQKELISRRIAEQNIFLTENFFSDILIDKRMTDKQIDIMSNYVTRYRKNLNEDGYFNA